jgi:hypothetical protein
MAYAVQMAKRQSGGKICAFDGFAKVCDFDALLEHSG